MAQEVYDCPPGVWTKLDLTAGAARASIQCDGGGGDLSRPIAYAIHLPDATAPTTDTSVGQIFHDREIVPWELNGADAVWIQPVNPDETITARVVA